jgi:hypothetical protein
MTFSQGSGLVLPSFFYRIMELKLPAVACTYADFYRASFAVPAKGLDSPAQMG